VARFDIAHKPLGDLAEVNRQTHQALWQAISKCHDSICMLNVTPRHLNRTVSFLLLTIGLKGSLKKESTMAHATTHAPVGYF